MYKVFKPKYIEDKYISSILIKVCKSKEYLLDFIKGKFYMNTNNSFAEIEKRELLTEAQFDELEGVKTVLNATNDKELLIDISQGKPILIQRERNEFENEGISIKSAYLSDDSPCNIYCMYSLWYGKHDGDIMQMDKRIIEGLGEYCAIILNKEEFINRIERAVNNIPYKLKKNIKYGFVEYIDTKKDSNVQLGVFRKDKAFIYQHEFRIALELDRELAPLKYFEVGDLSDIIIVGRTEYLLNIKLNNNCIIIGDYKIPIK